MSNEQSAITPGDDAFGLSFWGISRYKTLVLATVLLSACVLALSITVLRQPILALDAAGIFAFAEILLILFISVLPVVWRWSTVGVRALTEPLSLMSGSYVLYFVLRGA